MLITRLFLRNFRVYEEELDLALPPGLVGIYGPNGAGKSTLLEAILFTLWGKARTGRDQIRSAGVGADCITEVTFEHEGHLYLVRRWLSGINSTVRAEAHCDGLVMSEGARDTAVYVHSVLGLDDAAFRASVFAEQKQLAAFSSHSPADRRRLVLGLLGITPLDAARDAARRDSRQSNEDHQRLRAMLPDLGELGVAAEDADAAAGAAEKAAQVEETAAGAVRRRWEEARVAFERLDGVRQEYDLLVAEGKGARARLQDANQAVDHLREELAALDRCALELARCEARSAGLVEAEQQLRLLGEAAAAASAALAIVVGPEPAVPESTRRNQADAAAIAARDALADCEGRRRAVEEECSRARQALERSSTLSGEADCPICGQALGSAFEQVKKHRAAEMADAEARLANLAREREKLVEAMRAAEAGVALATRELSEAVQAHSLWEQATARHADAEERLERAVAALAAAPPVPGRTILHHDCIPPADGQWGALVASVSAEVEARRQASRAAERLRGRLERRSAVERDLAAQCERVSVSTLEVTQLLDKAKALGFGKEALAAARRQAEQTATSAQEAEKAAAAAKLHAARERTRALAAAEALERGREQHAKLAELESEARHLARLADLLSEFRNTVVASVGPRLATQAADLFGELTDREYDQLLVDPETYELQISDGGRVYGLDRFSGSEVDLANLALRVAISEHVRFQSGGSVGLLVLDEVFGPLDEDRKARMLLALERLRGRFRQVLVVTHDAGIKDQLPNAIEVVKRPGRRATARLVEA